MVINWDHPVAIKLRQGIVDGMVEDMKEEIRKTLMGTYKVYRDGNWQATCKYIDDAFLLVDHTFDYDLVKE